MSRSFRFKPALLKAEREFELDGPLLRADDQTLDLRYVTAVAYAETTVQYTTNRYLELDIAGHTHRIGQNLDASAGPEARQPFSHLVVAILRALDELHPDLRVTYGMRGGARIGMFIVGVLCLIAGLVLPIAAVASGVSGDRMAAAALPSILLFLLGVAFAWSNRPWKKPPRVKLSKLIDALDAATGSSTPHAN